MMKFKDVNLKRSSNGECFFEFKMSNLVVSRRLGKNDGLHCARNEESVNVYRNRKPVVIKAKNVHFAKYDLIT